MKCGDVEFLIQDHLDGNLLPSQREVLDAHLEDCSDCRLLLGEMASLDAGFTDIPDINAPGDLEERVLRAMPRKGTPRYAAPRLFVGFSGLAAAAVILLFFGIFLESRYDLLGSRNYDEVELVFFAPTADSVTVVGDFNAWDAERHPMAPGGEKGFWRARIRLTPGIYQYGFLIDGDKWMSDPKAENLLKDGFGRENSLLFIDG